MNLTNKCKRLNIILVSPSGTESVLVPLEAELTEERNKKVQFRSVHFWNERAFGIWRLLLSYPSESCSGRAYIQEVSLTLYGTKALKASYNQEQHFADICSGFQNNEYTKQQTWGIVNLVVSDLLRNPSILTKAVFIALGFIFGITSLVLVHIFIYCKQKSISLSTAQCGGI